MGITASSVGSTNKGRETTSSASTIATDASTSVDSYSSSPTATSVVLHTSPKTSDKRPRDPVGPEFFYSSKLRIQCPNPDWTLNYKIRALIADYAGGRHLMPPNAVNHQDEALGVYSPHVLYVRQWATKIRDYRKHLVVDQDENVQWDLDQNDSLLQNVRNEQRDCRQCLCDAQGNITFAHRGPKKPKEGRRGQKSGCFSGSWALFCTWFYGCYCAIVLIGNQPSAEHIQQGLTWHAFQDAFNQIPDYIRDEPFNRDFRWWVPKELAERPGQTIGYNPGFRVNVASPNEPPYFLEGLGESVGEDLLRELDALLDGHQEAVPSLPFDDAGFDPGSSPEDPHSNPNYQGGGLPQEDPFPVDIEAYARQQASLWPLPNANQPLPLGQDAPSFFPMDIPADYENYLIDDGTSGGGSGGYSYEYPPGNYDFPAEFEYNSGPRGGGGGSGSGGGFFKKREAKFENSKAGDDETAHGIEGVDQGRRKVAAPT
ncbi:hypothetical protein TWF970_006296 [Orbilia oligospora]|uniref:Uncharacterized protein n=1 Tax=Orbilia oligospora TaxID=2813651 RepID=A0A7C8V6G2_ORBOL|nr:hypothetical protein TWF970_006296 [Orbilia oligospora]